MALRVLIIEDERLIARDIEYTVEDAGHIVVGIAKTTDEAAQMVSAHSPDCATLNFTLLDGPSTAAAANLHAVGVPFVLLSNDSKKAKALLPMSPWRVIDKIRQDIALGPALDDLADELAKSRQDNNPS